MVTVSFIIPTYNCLAVTQAMLASLQATLPAGLDHEIIFVDDGSTDGTREWLQGLSPGPRPALRVLLNERNLGYAAANNRAVRVAEGRLLALLNDDLVLQPRWLEPMLAAHRALGPRAGIIGNVQLDAKTGAVDHAGIVINATGKPVHARALPARGWRVASSIRRVPALTAACVLLERSLWEQLGGFDEGFVNGGEDVDLCFRARAAGRINAVALDSVIGHHVSSSPGRKLRDEQNSFRLARRWGGEFIAAADDASRAWCRDYLAAALVQPRARDYRVAIGALLHAAHLRAAPPAAAVTALEAGLAREFQRWDKMFGPPR